MWPIAAHIVAKSYPLKQAVKQVNFSKLVVTVLLLISTPLGPAKVEVKKCQ